MWLGGGSHETLMLELLLGFTAVTVTALGGALGTEETQRSQKAESYELKAAPRKTRVKSKGTKKSRDEGLPCFYKLITFFYLNNVLRKV